MPFNCPLSLEKAARLIDAMALTDKNRVLDAGCGRGEFLIRLIEATNARGLGIDIDADLIRAAEIEAAKRLSPDTIGFLAEDVKNASLKNETFDAAICLGSTHAFGDGYAAYPNAVNALTNLVRPGGQILIGEGYWKQTPAQEYVELLGEPVGIYHDHHKNMAIAEQSGLIPLYAAVSNEDEWDHFEWSHRMRFERMAAENPDDPAASEKLSASRRWHAGYLRWGRSTMGFGFYLFMKPLGSK
ncbi:MAG: class I SAM-dependent methyltransferase [Chloroflexota bacterium]